MDILFTMDDRFPSNYYKIIPTTLTCIYNVPPSSTYRDPDRVMLCLLPETIEQNVSIRIQHTLMEAYCRENGIPVIKVGQGVCLLFNFLGAFMSFKCITRVKAKHHQIPSDSFSYHHTLAHLGMLRLLLILI